MTIPRKPIKEYGKITRYRVLPVKNRILVKLQEILAGGFRNINGTWNTTSKIKHNHEEDQPPDFEKAKIIKYVNNLRLQKILESAIISTNENSNHHPGSYNLAKNFSNKILEEKNMKISTTFPHSENG